MARPLSPRRPPRLFEWERRSTVRAVETPAARSEVPSPGRWIRPGRVGEAAPKGSPRILDWPTCPHLTPSGGGHAPTPDRSKTPAKDHAQKGIDTDGPVTEAPMGRSPMGTKIASVGRMRAEAGQVSRSRGGGTWKNRVFPMPIPSLYRLKTGFLPSLAARSASFRRIRLQETFCASPNGGRQVAERAARIRPTNGFQRLRLWWGRGAKPRA